MRKIAIALALAATVFTAAPVLANSVTDPAATRSGQVALNTDISSVRVYVVRRYWYRPYRRVYWRRPYLRRVYVRRVYWHRPYVHRIYVRRVYWHRRWYRRRW